MIKKGNSQSCSQIKTVTFTYYSLMNNIFVMVSNANIYGHNYSYILNYEYSNSRFYLYFHFIM